MQKFNKEKYLRRKKFKRYYKCIYASVVLIFLGILLNYFAYSKFSISKEEEVVKTTVGEFIHGDVVIGAYINGEYSKEIPKKDNGYVVEKVVCDNDALGSWNDEEWYLIVKDLSVRTKCNIYFKNAVYNFDYTGGEQTLTVPVSGTYKLEVWGAQGGKPIADGVIFDLGGFGGYATGYVSLTKGDKIYINVGGTGAVPVQGQDTAGGYNGGGLGTWDNNSYEAANNIGEVAGGGGGATHISLKSGLLSTLENYLSTIYIIAGGGGGGSYLQQSGGSGGGISGNQGEHNGGTGGTQMTGCNFGRGCDGEGAGKSNGVSGGGGGYYGGNINPVTDSNCNSAGGGSGYIGNTFLTNKAMYCYNCSESSEENTKTISTTCSEETPIENCAKKGNGYARITFVDTP